MTERKSKEQQYEENLSSWKSRNLGEIKEKNEMTI